MMHFRVLGRKRIARRARQGMMEMQLNPLPRQRLQPKSGKKTRRRARSYQVAMNDSLAGETKLSSH